MGDQKIETIQKIYEAFGTGDVPAILDQLSDDLDFGSEVDSKVAPWHGLRRTKPEVAEFFQAIGENLEVTEFTVLSITSNDTDVMAVIRFGVEGSRDRQEWHDGHPPLVALRRRQGLLLPRHRRHRAHRRPVEQVGTPRPDQAPSSSASTSAVSSPSAGVGRISTGSSKLTAGEGCTIAPSCGWSSRTMNPGAISSM